MYSLLRMRNWLEYFKETTDRHNLIVTDLRMPGMCGTVLAKKIR